MGWTFYNASGEALTSFGPVALTDLDIDGGTDVGEAIVDADLFIIDNGAGGTNVKTAASRIATYIASKTASGRVLRSAGAITTTSTSLVDLTGATLTLTTGAFPLAYSFACNVRISTAGRITLNVDLGGALQLGSAGIGSYIATADDVTNMSFSGMTADLSAGSNTIKVQWKTGAGTATMDADSGAHYLWAAHEIR
jgi:hypothetical protein